MQKKDYRKYLYYLFSICYVLAALLFSVHFWSFNEKFYESEHSKLKLYGKSIAEHIGISNEDLSELTHFTLSYLNDADASLDKKMLIHGTLREVFTEDEKMHMIDVQALNLLANKLLIGSILICIALIVLFICKKYPVSQIKKYYFRFLITISSFFLVLGIWILIDFDSFWTMFHHVFFPSNDLWLLDPRKDILIMIVPPEFFNHLVLYIFTTFIFLILLSVFVFKYLSKKEKMA